MNLWFDFPVRLDLFRLELDAVERCAARRQYRALRVAIYVKSPGQPMYRGSYGMSRADARRRVADYYTELSECIELGLK